MRVAGCCLSVSVVCACVLCGISLELLPCLYCMMFVVCCVSFVVCCLVSVGCCFLLDV